MILTAHQPAYLPWLGLLHKIALSDVFVFMDDTKYSKSDFSNRNRIKHPEGKKHWLSIPLQTGGSDNVSFEELKIHNDRNWQKKHLETIKQFYARAPYLAKYPDLFLFYEKEYFYLNDITYDMLRYFLKILNIKTEVKRSSEYKIDRLGNDYLIALCKRENADLYIFGILGRQYVDEKKFEESNIKIYFQDYEHPEYPQLYGDFVSHLSIIDLLFNCGDESLEILMSGNITKNELSDAFSV